MTTQTFAAGPSPQVILTECVGKLTVEAWDERSIAVETEAAVDTLSQDGATVVVQGFRGDLRLRVPAGTSVSVADQRGDVAVRDIASFTLERGVGDLRAEALSGAIRLRDIYGPTWINGAASLSIEPDTRPRRKNQWRRARREIEVYNTYVVEVAEASDNLTVATAQHAAIGSVGGNLVVREVAGTAQIGDVGGNADLRNISSVMQIGNIGGNLQLDAAPLAVAAGPAQATKFVVGGNAQIELPDEANLTIHATTGGLIRAEGISSTHAGGMTTIRYGDGAARLDLTVGGNLKLHGGAPEIVSALSSGWARAGATKRHRTAERGSEHRRAEAALRAGAEDQRIAILHLVAEGRLSPEEAERRLSELDL